MESFVQLSPRNAGLALLSRADREALAVVERAAAAAGAPGERLRAGRTLVARLQAPDAVSPTARRAQVPALSGRPLALLAALPPLSRLHERTSVSAECRVQRRSQKINRTRAAST